MGYLVQILKILSVNCQKYGKHSTALLIFNLSNVNTLTRKI